MPETAPLWIVGKCTDRDGAWDFQGLYALEADAVARCEDAMWFVGPVHVDQHVPSTKAEWPGAYRPILAEAL